MPLMRFMLLFFCGSQDQLPKLFHLFGQIVDALLLPANHPLLFLHRLYQRHDKTGIAEAIILLSRPRDFRPSKS